MTISLEDIDSAFPIEILITEKDHKDCGKKFIVEWENLPLGVSFKVLRTKRG